MKVCEIKVSYSNLNTQKLKIKESKDVFTLALNHWNIDTIEMQEEVKVLLLNRCNNVIGIYELSRGGITASLIDIKLVLAVALKAIASSIIVIHNHPSGNLNPSNADKEITRKLKEACKVVELELLDHLIITKKDYFSFANEGLVL